MESEKLERKGLLYVYGFEWCNPNGDPAFDNEPRIWEDRVIVTDVFLKRRIRDYIASHYSQQQSSQQQSFEIFLREIEKQTGEKMTQEERVKELLKEQQIQNLQEAKEKLKEKCWDIRVFGCMIPLERKEKKEEEGGGKALKLIGPVQATFGVSLNKVEKLECTITNVMPSKEEKAKGGSIGRKYVVPVAIVEQYIFVNDIAAKESGMKSKDYNKLVEALKNLTLAPTCSTSSKHLVPLLIVELTFNEEKYASIFGLLEIKELKENPKSLFDFEIDCSKVINEVNELKKNENKILNQVKYYVKKEYKSIFKGLPSEKNLVEEF